MLEDGTQSETFCVQKNVSGKNEFVQWPVNSYQNLGGCPFGQDEMWNITWPATNASTTARQKCPGSSEAQGKYFHSV